MTANEFYDKRLKEDSTIGSVQLMEEYAELKAWEAFIFGMDTDAVEENK